MKRAKLLVVLAALVLVAALAGCTPAKPVSTGAFAGSTYSNDYFNLTFKAPDGWTIATKEEIAQVFNAAIDEVGTTDKDTADKLKLSQQKVLYLALVLKNPLTDTEENNPNFNVIAENLGLNALSVSNSADYAKANLDAMKTASPNAVYGDVANVKLNGADFASVDSTTALSDGSNMMQRAYFAVKNGYGLVFTFTWFDDTDFSALQSLIDTISIK